MVYKSVFAVILLLCITETIQAGRINLGSGSIRSNGVFGKKDDIYYSVPSNVYHVSLNYNDDSTHGLTIGGGNGRATVSWSPGGRARVHAWVNGKASWWGKKFNKISWTVWGWTK
jgi:hypothetical protein